MGQVHRLAIFDRPRGRRLLRHNGERL